MPVVKGLGYFTLTEGVVARLLQPWPVVPRQNHLTRDGTRLVATLVPCQQLNVGTSFIGGGDQSYFARP